MYFTFKEKDSRDFDITILKSPKFKTPNYRRYETEVQGRHGAHVRLEGLTSYTFSVDILVKEAYLLDTMNWLKGRGLYSYHLQPNRFIEADIQGEISYEHIGDDMYKATITAYAHDATWFEKGTYIKNAGTSTIVNEGTFNSKPLMKLVRGNVDKADITINGVRLVYDFKGEDHGMIDCETQEAYLGATKRNHRLISGHSFPILKPGNNTIKTNVKIEFERKDRWL